MPRDCNNIDSITSKNNYSNIFKILSPASEASREVANLTERKNPHSPIYGVKEFVYLSVCL